MTRYANDKNNCRVCGDSCREKYCKVHGSKHFRNARSRANKRRELEELNRALEAASQAMPAAAAPAAPPTPLVAEPRGCSLEHTVLWLRSGRPVEVVQREHSAAFLAQALEALGMVVHVVAYDGSASSMASELAAYSGVRVCLHVLAHAADIMAREKEAGI